MFDWAPSSHTTGVTRSALGIEAAWQHFEKKSFPTKKINIKTQNQKNFTVFEDKKSLPICYLTENNVLHQELDTLISKIEKNKKLVKVKDEIRSIKSDSDNNELVLESGDKIYSSLIIGVDGANSKIRKIQVEKFSHKYRA